jgi:hypothetical protein
MLVQMLAKHFSTFAFMKSNFTSKKRISTNTLVYTLPANFSETGALNNKEGDALVGVALMSRDSGFMRERKIKGERASVRTILLWQR